MNQPEGLDDGFGCNTDFLPHAFRAAHVAVPAAGFGIVNLPCVAVRAAFGTALRQVLQDTKPVRVFNLVTESLLVLSLVLSFVLIFAA